MSSLYSSFNPLPVSPTGTSPHLDPLCTLAPIKILLNIEEVLTLVSNLSWTNLFLQTLVTVPRGISCSPQSTVSHIDLQKKHGIDCLRTKKTTVVLVTRDSPAG